MDLERIKQLIELMDRNQLAELELESKEDGYKVHLRKKGDAVREVHPVPPVPVAAAPPGPVAAGGGAPAAEAIPEEHLIRSPMVGTLYRASSPEAESFVEVGDTVEEGDTLCIIEAMKVMNEVKAERSVKIESILVENGEPVEFGTPLFRIS